MFGKIAGLATGYLLAWTISTPQGRKAAAQFGRAALRQCGKIEHSLINQFKKEVPEYGQSGETETPGTHAQSEEESA